MTEPKTEVDRRFDRIELAIITLITILEEDPTGITSNDIDLIKEILNGKSS